MAHLGANPRGLGTQMVCMTKRERRRLLVLPEPCVPAERGAYTPGVEGQRCVSSPSGAVSSSASLGSMSWSRDANRLVSIPTFAASLTTGSSITPR